MKALDPYEAVKHFSGKEYSIDSHKKVEVLCDILLLCIFDIVLG